MKIISWNVNGIRAVFKKGFMDWLKLADPDILCLQETKAEEAQIEKQLAEIRGYHWVFCSSTKKKGYSGVAIFSKEKPLAVEKGLGHDPFDSEGRSLIARFPGFTLCNIYFPNGKSGPERLKYKMDFYAHFLTYVNALKKKGGVVVCGDVNTAHKEIDLARPKENSTISGFLPEERAWMDTFVANGYVDTFRLFNQQPGQYSWWDMKSGARARNVGWRIDYFFVSGDLKPKVKNAYILPDVLGSDHCPVGMDLAAV